MNAHTRIDLTLSRPGWEPREVRFYDPVDVVLIFRTPDGIARTLHHGTWQTISDAQEAISDVTVWIKQDTGRWLSECGRYRIQPVCL